MHLRKTGKNAESKKKEVCFPKYWIRGVIIDGRILDICKDRDV